MPDVHLSNREWIAANPLRHYRIIRRSEPNGAGQVYADITSFNDDRHVCSRQRIIMRSELPDTDVAAILALDERNAVPATTVEG